MNTKLTAQEREEIRRLRKSGLLYREIAEMFRISKATITRVCYEPIKRAKQAAMEGGR